MTRYLAGADVASRVNDAYPDTAVRWSGSDFWVGPEHLAQTAEFLKDTPGLDFAFLTSLSAVDYVEYFEMVYHLLSMRHNHIVIMKTRVYGRDEPIAASVTSLWRGANLQEREIWDLMGIRFEDHPNMKRVLLWEDFPGHPLRKDYTD